jgi:hypothetical protein
MTIEQHIEELRTELKNAFDTTERRQIEVELELAEADLMVAPAEQEGTLEAEAAFLAALPADRWRRLRIVTPISCAYRFDPASSTSGMVQLVVVTQSDAASIFPAA